MIPYASEQFTEQERRLLSRYFTNDHLPVFALVNLPEVVKGALFARYSRSDKSLRRLFLDEFADDLSDSGLSDSGLSNSGDRVADGGSVAAGTRAEKLYDKVFLDYGDDSVAQLGGVHLACEQASNLLTKILERGRLAAYLEQSTRYVPYDSRLPNGRYRYYRDPGILGSDLGARYVADMDRAFDTYGSLLGPLQAYLAREHSRPSEVSELAWRRSVRAQALDALRGLLPVGALSNVGIYASGQSFEQLLIRMRTSSLPEAASYSDMMLEELRKVIPSFLTRVDRPDRGVAWGRYMVENRSATTEVARRLLADESAWPQAPVTLVDYDRDGEDKVLAAILYSATDLPEVQLLERVRRLSQSDRDALMDAYVGRRGNRRQKPGRAFELARYRFDVVSDYGAFRDLQRHRMLNIEWQPLSTELGYEVPTSVVEAGLGGAYEEAMVRSAALYDVLGERFPQRAPYALGLAWRIRFAVGINARAAMHMLELRSAPQGHPSYRRIAQQMHSCIAEQAGHRSIARAMSFVDHGGTVGPGRLEAERRLEHRRLEAGRAG